MVLIHIDEMVRVRPMKRGKDISTKGGIVSKKTRLEVRARL